VDDSRRQSATVSDDAACVCVCVSRALHAPTDRFIHPLRGSGTNTDDEDDATQEKERSGGRGG
jgi:hypothetical protein